VSAPRRLRRAARAAALAVAVPLLLAGCLPSAPPPPTTSTPTGEDVAPDLERFYHQVLTWDACVGLDPAPEPDAGLQCATAVVPLDWDAPAGDTIDLALIRRAATGERRGSLLINPGGPGGSGVDFVRDSLDAAAGPALQERFDIVGFDPRGVNHSTSVVCGTPADRDDFFFGIVPGVDPADPASPGDGEIGGDDWIAASEQRNGDWGALCLDGTGALLGEIDTGSAVRDLDVLRAALGEDALDYLGYSYGTYLGARYAEAFPARVGRFVLDGAVDPAMSEFETTLTQARGFESAFRAYLADCLGRDDCPFTGSVETAVARTERIVADLATDPLRAPDGRLLGLDSMFKAIILPLYSESNWPLLDDLFTEVPRGATDTAFLLADAYHDRSAGQYSSNNIEAFLAINCLDYPRQTDPEVMRSEAAQLAEAAPLFGPRMAYGGTLCARWPFEGAAERAPISAPGSPDILVLGTTNDPATPYADSVTLAGTLEKGRLVTREGEGHTAYNKGNACVDETVEDFLVDGVVPRADPMC
jgi:pimeloyl-ACP methyl ester carboxylesterase